MQEQWLTDMRNEGTATITGRRQVLTALRLGYRVHRRVRARNGEIEVTWLAATPEWVDKYHRDGGTMAFNYNG